MMNSLRRFFLKLLGTENYLRWVSRLFYIFYYTGLLRYNKTYHCHYFVNRLVKKSFTVIDIGANLGYYSRIFSKLVGNQGRVIAVEPVNLFRTVLNQNLSRCKNVEVLPFALGAQDGLEVEMGIPQGFNNFRFGTTRVLSGKKAVGDITFPASMRKPDTLFSELRTIDYIKCDIEGYEFIVLKEFKNLLVKHKPILQVEIASENVAPLKEYLGAMGYLFFYIRGSRICSHKEDEGGVQGDFIIVPKEKMMMV